MIKREASILKPILVTHDLENPTAKYLYENNIASWTEQHFRKDLEILLNCEAVVFDCSTIIFFIILYSKKLKRLYISDVLLDAYNGTPLSIGHMNINEIIGDKIELIIIKAMIIKIIIVFIIMTIYILQINLLDNKKIIVI